VIEAESRAAEDAVHAARTTGRSRNDEYVSVVQEKSRQLNEEMKRVARQDEQFLATSCVSTSCAAPGERERSSAGG
jgi:hypothetical protein